MNLSQQVYMLTSDFPSDEKFGLVSQMRRSSVSIASNIAEGSGRGTDKDFSRFLNIALGSAFELETQLLLSSRLKLHNSEVELNTSKQVQKMIHNLIKRFEKKS